MKEKRKLSPLKVGDRVRVYASHLRHGGSPGKVTWVSHLPNAAVKVLLDNSSIGEECFHPKQCRRLKPKKAPAAPERERVEWFEVVDENNEMQVGFGSRAHAETMVKANPSCRVAHLVELREGERILSEEALEKAMEYLRQIEKRPNLPHPERDADWRACVNLSKHDARMALKLLGFREEREP